jgi:hypothetical protein
MTISRYSGVLSFESVTADNKLLARLSRVFGPERLLTDPGHLEEVARDALGPGRLHPERRAELAKPLCVVLPIFT